MNIFILFFQSLCYVLTFGLPLSSCVMLTLFSHFIVLFPVLFWLWFCSTVCCVVSGLLTCCLDSFQLVYSSLITLCIFKSSHSLPWILNLVHLWIYWH